MKKMVLFLLGGLVMTSCVSNKKFRAVQEQLKTTEDLLNTATIKLNSCLKDKELLQSKNEMLAKNNARHIFRGTKITAYFNVINNER
ncbi:MAG: hypothetical protein ACFNX7_00310 [Capnocytophaga gingivalis]